MKVRYFLLAWFAAIQAGSFMGPDVFAQETFCNPLNLSYRFMQDATDAREAADATIVLFKDDYYLFASRSGGYWTSPDLHNWSLIIPEVIDMEGYAPTAVVIRDTLFFMNGGNRRIYKTADPKSGIWELGPVTNNYGDPAFFLDDDNRLYMLYGVSDVTPIRIVELDPQSFQEISPVVDVVYAQASIHGWERRGDDNLMDEQPWIEGAWMIKENGKYYFHYAGPGTEFKSYGDGIYVADSPLGPYEYATYSPFAFKPSGFISGAGHGSTFRDKDGNWWHIGTMTISVQHMFERRLGLAPVSIDEDGQIRCNTDWGDYPQYLPGIKENPIDENFSGMMLLSHKKFVMASSSMEGHGVENAVDEEARTYWAAQTGNSGEWMIVDLGKECMVEAVQVNFGEHGTDPDQVRGRDLPVYEQYLLETSSDGLVWDTLIDKSQNLEDVPHDYSELAQPVSSRYIRLSNVYSPGDGHFAVRGLRIFGNSDSAVITDVTEFTVERDTSDGRDAVIRWDPVENADGYIINYGIAPDKLYNNYMVYDTDSLSIHSLNHGVEYHFRIRAFDSGTDYYRKEGEFRSFQSGNWNDMNTWAMYDGKTWENPVSAIPELSDGPISIQEGHTVTVSESDSVDQVRVEVGGILEIAREATLQVKDYIGTDLSVEGIIRSYGDLHPDSSATISFSKEARYEHKQDGGTLPTAIWTKNSTCILDSIKTSAPANGNQDFHNIIWNCPHQTESVSLEWNGIIIGGNIVVQSTGTGQWLMCDPEAGEKVEVTLLGDFIMSGGNVASSGSETANTAVFIHQEGSIDISGGVFSLTGGSQGGSGTTTWMIQGDVALEDAGIQNANQDGARFVFSGEGTPHTLSFSNVNFGEGGFPVVVDTGSIIDLGTSMLEGNGPFHLKPGATLITAHAMGINGSLPGTGIKVFDQGTRYTYNGSVAQTTGTLLPDIVGILTICNAEGVALSKSVSIGELMDVKEGTLTSGPYTLSYESGASLKYSGSEQQTSTSAEFPEVNGPENLIMDNPRSVKLHESRSVHFLDLQRKIDLGSNTLTVDTVSDAAYNRFVITTEGGTLKISSVGETETLFPVGVNTYQPVWISNTGQADAITVGAINDTVADREGNTVRVLWNLGEDVPGDGNYRITFGWSTGLEGTGFRSDRENMARIYNLADTTEAGEGEYAMQFSNIPYTLSRGGIAELGTFGVGMFQNPTANRDHLSFTPEGYTLYGNYPNPFRTSTTLRFAIPKHSMVTLKVYNMLGEEVEDLAGRIYPQGVHSEVFTGSNAGIYFVVFKADEFIQTIRMVQIGF